MSTRPSRPSPLPASLPALLPLLLCVALPAAAAAPAEAPPRSPPRVERALSLEVPDERLVDQDGKPVRLASELLKDRVVAVNFVFTTCSTICSPMSAVFSKLHRELGDAVGRDVFLVSITLDPARDTPEKLKKFASLFKQRTGWTFVTGEPARVTRALKALGGWVPDKESHTPVTLVGNTATGKWLRVYGMPTPQRLKDALGEVGLAVPTKKAEVQ